MQFLKRYGSILLSLLILGGCSPIPTGGSAREVATGVRGKCYRVDGNFMPGSGPRSRTYTPLTGTLRIYKYDRENPWILQGLPPGAPVARAAPDLDGRFFVELPPGEYQMYLSSGEGMHRSDPFVVRAHEVTDVNIGVRGNVYH
jgi:hypothetical protein